MTVLDPDVRGLPAGAEPPTSHTELPGLRKAAVLFAQLSKEEAAKLLPELRPREVERLTAELVELRGVDGAVVDDVLAEFHGLMRADRAYGSGGEEFARDVLIAAMGEDRADDVLARLTMAYAEVPFSSLRNADVRQLVTFLKGEHPQLVALVLAYLPAGQSAEVLSVLPGDLQAQVAHRIATTERTSPEMVRLLENELERRLGSLVARQDMTMVGGIQALVEIINRSARPTERSILERLDSTAPQLADQIRAQMFVFEDIVTIDDRSLQRVLREIEATDLAVALKGVRADVRDKVLRNLSERAAENLEEEIELLGAVRTSAVEEAQTGIVAVIRALEARGELTISRGDDEMID